MRSVLYAIMAFAAVVVAAAGTATETRADGQRDDFHSFDSGRWIKSDYALGRGRLNPANVSVKDGILKGKIPANTLNGSEIESKRLRGYGVHRVHMKTPRAPSSITGFYLYRAPDYNAEIDIEVHNDGSRKIDFVTYANGRKTNVSTKKLRFDPSAGFHTYAIRFSPHSLSFYVDGRLLERWSNGLPDEPMKLLLNTWFPTFLPGKEPSTDRYTKVNWIESKPL